MREDLDSIEMSVQSDRVAVTTPQATGSAQLFECQTKVLSWLWTRSNISTRPWDRSRRHGRVAHRMCSLKAWKCVCVRWRWWRKHRTLFGAREIGLEKSWSGAGGFLTVGKWSSKAHEQVREQRLGSVRRKGDRTIVKSQPGDASPTRRPTLEASAAGSRGQSRGSYVGAQFPLVVLIARATSCTRSQQTFRHNSQYTTRMHSTRLHNTRNCTVHDYCY